MPKSQTIDHPFGEAELIFTPDHRVGQILYSFTIPITPEMAARLIPMLVQPPAADRTGAPAPENKKPDPMPPNRRTRPAIKFRI